MDNKTMYAVNIHYTFDADTPVFLLNDFDECIKFIKEEFEKECKINSNSIGSTFISDDGEYACITYLDDEEIEWHATYITDLRSNGTED